MREEKVKILTRTQLYDKVQDSESHGLASVLPVMEHFYTIQGEGFHQGKAAYFIRLAGCDVGCVWCDVKESWTASKHQEMKIEEIVHAVSNDTSDICIITGGEPFMHDLTELTNSLRNQNKHTHAETSGAYLITGIWDWICLSPKKFKPPLSENLSVANELKVVVYNKSDFAWAEKFQSLVNNQCVLFLQPEWSRRNEMLPLMIEYVKQHPKWNISLQIHKYMNIP